MIKCNKRHGGWDNQRYGKLWQDCVLDVTLETQDHVGTALDEVFGRNTVTCWVGTENESDGSSDESLVHLSPDNERQWDEDEC